MIEILIQKPVQFMINCWEKTPFLFAVVSIALSFIVQFFFLLKTRHLAIKLIPVYLAFPSVVLFLIAFAGALKSGGRGFDIFFIFMGLPFLSIYIGLAVAWMVYRHIKKNRAAREKASIYDAKIGDIHK